MTKEATQYGLIGCPLKNSFSSAYFTGKFKMLGIDANYKNYPLASIEELKKLRNEVKNLRGLNITIPYKHAVISYLDMLDETAAKVGAVNTIKFNAGNAIGYNTDVYGFERSILPLLNIWHQNALVLGSGGASKAVVYVLEKLGIKHTLVSRNPESAMVYEDIDKGIIRSHQLIINCTPLGMFPLVDDCPPIPYEYITNLHLVYDLVYTPEETLFLKQAKAHGAVIKNGLEMLHLQADKAWEIWNDIG